MLRIWWSLWRSCQGVRGWGRRRSISCSRRWIISKLAILIIRILCFCCCPSDSLLPLLYCPQSIYMNRLKSFCFDLSIPQYSLFSALYFYNLSHAPKKRRKKGGPLKTRQLRHPKAGHRIQAHPDHPKRQSRTTQLWHHVRVVWKSLR